MPSRVLFFAGMIAVAVAGILGPGSPSIAQATDPADARIRANEFAAIAQLRNLCAAQAQFQACAAADEDNDGTGEYGVLAELSSALPVRGTKSRLNPPVLSGAYKVVSETGTVTRAGYVMAIYLPGEKGVAVPEGPGGGVPSGVLDPDLAECVYLAYAWPEEHGRTGRRTFVINQYGDIYATKTVYSGAKRPPPLAAFAPPPANPDVITGLVGPEHRAADGLTWAAPPGVAPAVPFEAGVRANETAARATLKVLASASAQFWAAARVDEDGDGKGEFGTFGEMSGARPCRGRREPIRPPELSAPFKTLAADGTFRRGGYRFAIWLPGPAGVGVRETKDGLAGGRTDPDLAERYWIVYAWPEEHGETGRRTYVMTQASEIFWVDHAKYSGDAAPRAGAAVQPRKAEPKITGPIATNREVWTHVN
jgi:hypothetical protein